MKYFCYALILCLKILAYAQEDKVVTSEQKATLEEIQKAIASLKKLTEKLVSQYNTLSERIEMLSAQYENLYTIVSTPVADVKQQRKIISILETLVERYNELNDRVQRLYSKFDEISSGREGVSETATLENVVAPQYLKIKVKEGGQEAELLIDPTYVDINFNIVREGDTKETSVVTPKEKKSISEAKDEEVKIKATDINNLIRHIRESVEKERKFVKAEKTTISEEAINELYRAQRLFYAKRYNAALAAVQKSLSKQETALGYALEGSIYFTLGDLDLAIESWQEALRLNPDMEEVRAILSRYRRR